MRLRAAVVDSTAQHSPERCHTVCRAGLEIPRGRKAPQLLRPPLSSSGLPRGAQVGPAVCPPAPSEHKGGLTAQLCVQAAVVAPLVGSSPRAALTKCLQLGLRETACTKPPSGAARTPRRPPVSAPSVTWPSSLCVSLCLTSPSPFSYKETLVGFSAHPKSRMMSSRDP